MGRGEYTRWDAKWTVESRQGADIRQMARDGLIGADRNSVVLICRSDDGESRSTIQLEWTSCHFGGCRPWFLCPICQGRYALIYWRWNRWGCRTCQNLTYTTSQSSQWVRTVRKASKARDRLVVHDGRIWRPKGMHRRTFLRLIEEDRHLNASASEATMAMIVRSREDHDRFMRRTVGCTGAEFQTRLKEGRV
jgi:hypothetical protein